MACQGEFLQPDDKAGRRGSLQIETPALIVVN